MPDWTDNYTALQQQFCTHKKVDGTSAMIHHQMINGENWHRCMRCSATFKGDDAMSAETVWQESGHKGGTGYYRRKLAVPVADPTGGAWEFVSWKKGGIVPVTRQDAIETVMGLNAAQAGVMEYAMLQCSKCHKFHGNWDAWKDDICDTCEADMENENTIIQAKGPALKKKIGLGSMLPMSSSSGAMKKNDVRRLNKNNAPMGSEQWAVQGSAAAPYVITHYNHTNGSTTEEGWACSCMAFTRNTPREDCKHILRVKNFEGITVGAPKVGANLPASQKAAFEKFLAMQKAKEQQQEIGGTSLLVETGRRFR